MTARGCEMKKELDIDGGGGGVITDFESNPEIPEDNVLNTLKMNLKRDTES